MRANGPPKPGETKASTGQWKRKLVNLWQTKEERREKYWLCRSLRANSAWSSRMKDWRLSKIERFFGLEHTVPDEDEPEQLDLIASREGG